MTEEDRMDKRTKFTLDEKEIPAQWYNIQADLPGHRATGWSGRFGASVSYGTNQAGSKHGALD